MGRQQLPRHGGGHSAVGDQHAQLLFQGVGGPRVFRGRTLAISRSSRPRTVG